MSPTKITQQLQQALEHHRAGRADAAERLYVAVCAAAPKLFDAWHLSGQLALQQRRPADAVERLTRAAKLNPQSAACRLKLAAALKAVGRLAEARGEAGKAAELDPRSADAHFLLGELAAALDGLAAAVAPFRRVTELQPEAADGWANLGVALAQSNGSPAEILAAFGRALAIDPNNVQALTGRAFHFQQTYDLRGAVAGYGEVLRRAPQRHDARSARLMSLQYLDDVSAEQLAAEHRAFGRLHPERPATLPHSPEPERRLRLAFLSPDLRAHSVAYFLEPLLAHLPAAEFEVILYHDHPKVDAVSERLRRHGATWRHVAGWSDAKLEQVIRDDVVDVLVDLAGHTGCNRLPLFARRLAPVQITYLGYPDTTGLPAMDYRFVDPVTDPAGAEARHTERLVRFAPTAWSYAPPPDAPAVVPPPSAAGAPVVFGCFNNFAKVSDSLLGWWSRILHAVPESRIRLKGQGLDSPGMAARIHEGFARHGLTPDRIELAGRTTGLAAHLACYGAIDIALDTFPYHGTTTTCDALWMGRPVIAVEGDRHASRVGASLLRAVGCPELIARDADEYVALAVSLAADRHRLAERCGRLREQMRASDLLAHARQAQRFGAAVRSCWGEWCARAGTSSLKTAV